MSVAHQESADNGSNPPDLVVNSCAIPAAWTAEDPDAAATLPAAVCEAALRYVEAGLSVIPIDAESGDKSPDQRRVRSWKIYQLRPPRKDEILSWSERGGLFGLAVLGGAVSGGEPGVGLEIIDFDTIELAAPWIEQVGRRAPGLIDRLVMVLSPRPGLHVYYRCRKFEGCGKLASAPATDAVGRLKKVTLIERKGEGGYCLVPPSPRRCHPRNRLYRIYGDQDLTQIPVISIEEREILLQEARSFNRWTEPEAVRVQPVSCNRTVTGNRPGDDFERRASWADILVPKGWTLVSRRGEVEDWRRSGKGDNGSSATVNYVEGKLYVFSSNADPFAEGQSYSKFAAYAKLYHGGVFQKAAEALQAEGYGRQGLPAGKRSGSSNVTSTVLRLDR